MKANSRIILGTALLLAIATAVAWDYARLERQTKDALAALDASQKRVAAELQQVEDRTAKASPAPARPLVREAGRTAMTAARAPFVRAQKDPKVQILQFAASRARAARTYGVLFRKLGLTPEQTARFLDNVAIHDEQLRDISAVVLPPAGTPASVPPEALAAATQLRIKANTDYQAAQQELAGEAANYPGSTAGVVSASCRPRTRRAPSPGPPSSWEFPSPPSRPSN